MKKQAAEILLVDFGSQTAHLISRRIKELGVGVTTVDPDVAYIKARELKPAGVVFSGGPASVYERGSPTVDPKVFNLGIPILGICYGQQLTAHLLGGKVIPSPKKEFGPALLKIDNMSPLFADIKESHFRVWMSHGDTVAIPPPGFSPIAETDTIRVAAMHYEKKRIYCVQFHPEVAHTAYGTTILKNFLTHICRLPVKKRQIDLSRIIADIRKTVGDTQVIAGVSGGVDSTVAAALVAKAVGKQLVPIYMDNGLMRPGTRELVESIFTHHFRIRPVIVKAKAQFLARLKGITDPEQKRKIIGALYIELFEKTAKRYPTAKFLVQGTIYSDVIESKGTKHADRIKSHHNVGGLPDEMKLTLLEPLREFYKDEVRKIGKHLKLPKTLLNRQPYPGPGSAIRIIGEVTEERLRRQQRADTIVMEELEKSGWLAKVFQSFAVLMNTKSTAVKGDGRFYGEVVAIRIYDSKDIMTAGWTRLPYTLLQRIASRIVNEVPGVSRVVYDITTKPPATMEWE